MLNRSAWQQLCSQPFSPIYGWTQAAQRSSSSETKEMDQADPPCRSPPPSISPSLHLYLSIHLCIVTPNNRPSRVSGLGQSQDCSLSPSLPSPLPGSTFPPLQTLSGLCQSNEQSLNGSTARKQMEPWDDLQHTERENEGEKRAVKLKRGVRNAHSKCSSGRRAQNALHLHIFPIYLLLN